MKLYTGSVTALAVLLGMGAIGWIWGRGPSAAIVHAADAGLSVTVASPLPLPVTRTASEPVQVSGGGAISGPSNFVLFVVPKGKRLVVEHFSSEAGIMSGTTVERYTLGIANNPSDPGFTSFEHFIPPSFSSPCGTCVGGQVNVVASQPISMYVEGGQALVANISFSGAVGPNASAFLHVSGYLVND